MEIKKNPKANLESYTKIFWMLGLVLALFITYVSIENKTYDRNFEGLAVADMSALEEEDIPITERDIQKPPPPPPPPALEQVEAVEDEKEIEETIVESTETDETEAVVVDEIEEVEIEEEVIEDVPFAIIEDVPVYPGCKGSKEELKECFSKKVQAHFNRKFDGDLPNELGLSQGKKIIIVGFKVSKTGSITDVYIRAPHPRLKKETMRIMELLPKIKPGRQRGKPVGVKYSFRLALMVE